MKKNEENKKKSGLVGILVGVGIGVVALLIAICIINGISKKDRILPFSDVKIGMTKDEIVKKYGDKCSNFGEDIFVHQKIYNEDNVVQVAFDEKGVVKQVSASFGMNEKEFEKFQKDMKSFYGEVTTTEIPYSKSGETQYKGFEMKYAYYNGGVSISAVKTE